MGGRNHPEQAAAFARNRWPESAGICILGVKAEDIWAKGRYRRIVEARSLLCYWAVRELGVTMSSLAVRLGISIPAVSKSVCRGKELAVARGYSLLIS